MVAALRKNHLTAMLMFLVVAMDLPMALMVAMAKGGAITQRGTCSEMSTGTTWAMDQWCKRAMPLMVEKATARARGVEKL